MKTCTNCQTGNPDNANYCRRCRSPFAAAVPAGARLSDEVVSFYCEDEGARRIYVFDAASWRIKSSGADWVHVSKGDDDSFLVSVDENPEDEARNSYVHILNSTNARPLVLKVNQDGKKTPCAKIEKVWADFDAEEDGKDGIRFHARISTHLLKGRELYLWVFFYDTENGIELLLDDQEEAVCRASYSTPPYDESIYEDWSVFVPEDDFRSSNRRGKHTVAYRMELSDKEGNTLVYSDYHEFSLNYH